MLLRPAASLLLLLCWSCELTYGESLWTQFRGVDGQGVSTATDLPVTWSEQQNVLWKAPLVGKGWSSPVYAHGKVWLTSATEIQASEADRAAAAAASDIGDALALAQEITLWLTQIDLATGEVIAQKELARVESPQRIHSLNSFASPTPVIADGRLFCHFGDYGTFCLDAISGEVVWQKRIKLEHSVGPGSSPIVHAGLLILTCDGMHSQFVVALDVEDGSEVWRTNRPPIRAENPEFRKAFCTPLVINVLGNEQVVIPGAQWCIAYDPRNGKEIWRVDHGSGFSNVPRPVYDGRHLYLCTGFATSQLWAIRPDGQGDVTDTHVAWKRKKQIPNMPSPVVFGERIYTVSDGGIAQCFQAMTGELLWKKRIGGKFSASPLLADRRLYLCSQEGRTSVLAAGDSFQQLAQNDLDGQLMASPVVIGNDLLLRTGTHLYRIGE